MSATECDSMDHVGNGCIETGNSIVDRVPVSSTRFQKYLKVQALAVNYFVYKMDVCVVCQQDFEKDRDRKSYNRRRITLRVGNRNCRVLDIVRDFCGYQVTISRTSLPQSTRQTVISSHCQLVTHRSHHTVNSSQENT